MREILHGERGLLKCFVLAWAAVASITVVRPALGAEPGRLGSSFCNSSARSNRPSEVCTWCGRCCPLRRRPMPGLCREM